MLIGVQNNRGWRTLTADVLAVSELAEDARFATNVERVRHRAACDPALAAQTAHWSTDELAERLAGAGVPAAQIKDGGAVVEHPQLQALTGGGRRHRVHGHPGPALRRRHSPTSKRRWVTSRPSGSTRLRCW